MKNEVIQDGEKTIKITDEVHRKLDIVKAKKQLKTFNATINYLIDYEYNHK